ncbi:MULTISPECIES: GlsB/YeaQ/YmgE family stress response membrane protein [unclassified Frankia]|uniref:GlsB/YeaQ/YmgE family stress response membrane protein n=1 Tax=unclassified Frankia TaxID=2632575 RepID=UPI002AD37724|nr:MULTISPECIES: GlsB/YeaQ/YmgE family stress response membrane protein [unclassified Frankia]
MLEFIVVMLLLGLASGAVARLVVPGPDHIGIGGTIAVGVVGSFVGGFLGYVLFSKDAGAGPLQSSGIVGSIIGAILVLLAWHAVDGRSTSRFRRSRRSRRYVRR